MGELADKVVLVTGAGGGIGRAVCRRAADDGAAVVATDLAGSGLDVTVAQVREAGGRCEAVEGDVTSSPDWRRAVGLAVEHFGGVDVLVNNAGIEGSVAPLGEYPEDVFDPPPSTP